MRYAAAAASRTDADRAHTVITLTSDAGAVAEVWPGLGCNTVRWQVPTAGGPRDVLYAPPPAELFARPTRGGIPVLFPFPNRIRNGYFVWDGHEYQLPRNDPAQANAIHGFTPRNSWGDVEHGSDAAGAWVRAEFMVWPMSTYEKANRQWPAQAVFELTIRLTNSGLRFESAVENLDRKYTLPFGLGFHPYFVATPDCLIQTPARGRWVLHENLPTGERETLSGALDLSTARAFDGLTLDDVYTDFPDVVPGRDGLVERGRVEYPGAGVLRVRTSPAFRELVLFTPPHRKAVCLEPYTCPTDAVNLTNAGMNVGWQVLRPGESWEGMVEYCWEET
jgi:aldose 1-epimerase